MVAAKSTKGYTIGFVQQASLTDQPTTGFDEMRLQEAPAFPTSEEMAEAQTNLGHENAYNWADEPITFKQVRENELTLPVVVRRAATTGVPPLAELAESGGCAVYSYADDTVATSTTNAFTLTTGLGADKSGAGILVPQSGGEYYPSLMSDYDDLTNTVNLAMDLPSAALLAGDVKRMYSITPQTGQVDASKLLSFLVSTRGAHTSDEDLAWYLRGCALGSFGEMTIEPNGTMMVSPTLHVADVDLSAVALAAESFRDTTYYQKNNGLFRFEFGNAAAAGAVASGYLELLTATVTLNHVSKPIPGEGSSDVLSSIQGYMADVEEQPLVVLELLMDKTYWDEFSTTGNINKHIGFVWPTDNLAVPASGLWLPNCYQKEPPVAEPFGEFFMKCTVTYAATAPKFSQTNGDDFSNNSTSMAPWVLAISGESA
jgi:hypothetical protein